MPSFYYCENEFGSDPCILAQGSYKITADEIIPSIDGTDPKCPGKTLSGKPCDCELVYLPVTISDRWMIFSEKKLKVIIAAIIIVSAILIGSIKYHEYVSQKKREVSRLENLKYQNQIDQLNQIESNVMQLLTFVDLHKEKLRESEDAILELQLERKKLQPLIEADRATVEAIFRLQQERYAANTLRERLIGFTLGIIASLLASFIHAAMQKKRLLKFLLKKYKVKNS